MTRIGVFGSSFNPPTLGHSILLAEARFTLGLDRVLVVPTGNPWHKDSRGAPRPELRLLLAEAAFGEIGWIEVSDIEVRREGPSCTCDTLEEIQSTGIDRQIFLLTGADAALGFGDWHRPERVLELARVAVAPRSGVGRAEIESVFEKLDGVERLEFFAMPQVDISSTLVRERIEAGGPWEHLVPHEAVEMIKNEDLYDRNQ
ncbi:MAG: nicotinate (nicotinamide) nucleotide adenylyltransferase [Solirubrobacterales bacterium]|nr:nicotinate (nicotinamide) nucleotide adenylyltransferase [Solirubrobacterales bacterium]HMT03998.1 nicotinate (nicotinamide) nucleotide adenylyltransferase [Solirubrobacterales bacterium]